MIKKHNYRLIVIILWDGCFKEKRFEIDKSDIINEKF